MDIKDRIKGCYFGWFFGPGAILRKSRDWNYKRVQENPEFARVKTFEQIPSDYKMYDQLAQTLIVHEIIVKNGKISPELFREKFLELNEKDDILNNDQYGPSSQKAIKLILEGKNVRETGKEGVTTGGAMRCMPIGVYFYKDEEKLLKNTYESCIISHNTDVAVDSALAVNLMMSYLLKGNSKKDALKKTLKILKKNRGKYGEPTAFAAIPNRIDDAIKWIGKKSFEESVKIIAERVGTSWYAIEAIPAGFAIYFATKNAKEAALMAFKVGYTHTAPQIACAFHGAEKGPNQFPLEIIKKIEKTNNININKLSEEITHKINLII
jgi:ADP-ribosylglycohydrolase